MTRALDELAPLIERELVALGFPAPDGSTGYEVYQLLVLLRILEEVKKPPPLEDMMMTDDGPVPFREWAKANPNAKGWL